MLNQTNIGANNNKFYVLQALKQGARFYTYTRWGRVVSVGDETYERVTDDSTGRARSESNPGSVHVS